MLKKFFKKIYNRLVINPHYGEIGIGLIGIGGWGRKNALEIMRSNEYNVIGIYDVNKALSEQFGKEFNITVFNSYESLLNRIDIEAVAITVPNNYHSEYIYKACEKHKHVFIEKPLTSDPESCKILGNLCDQKDLILFVGHQIRREPVFLEIKKILNKNEIGMPIHVQGINTIKRTTPNDWRNDRSACPGGSMEQLGIHLIDLLIYLFGKPVKKCGWQKNIPYNGKADWAMISMLFNNDISACISTSFSTINHFELKIFCENGKIIADRSKLMIITNNKRKIYKPSGISGSRAQFHEFAQCIRTGARPQTDWKVAAEVMEISSSIFKNV